MRTLMMVLAVTAVVVSPALATPLPEEDLGEMAAGRVRLEAVQVPEVREVNPELVARAETAFDCWIINPEARAPEGDFAACRGDFMAAMSQLEKQLRTASSQDLAAIP
jgi:hypothetical protein